MSARIEEIRQENRSGDVSYRDIEWLCRRAEEADRLLAVLERGSIEGESETIRSWCRLARLYAVELPPRPGAAA